MKTQTDLSQLKAIASRLREMREIMGWSPEEMAEKTDTTPEEYRLYEAGRTDMPFTFILKSSQAFNMELTELLEGQNAFLSSYTVTRRGKGESTAREEGIAITNLAPKFRDKIAEPYWVRYEYSEKQQNEPIHLTTHQGQEFDLVLQGSLKVQVGEHVEVLHESLQHTSVIGVKTQLVNLQLIESNSRNIAGNRAVAHYLGKITNTL